MIKWIDQLDKPLQAGALCIGSFDGVHLGHKALIKETLNASSSKPSFGLSFSPHPREYFHSLKPNQLPDFERILPEEMNAALLKSEGLDEVFYIEFNATVSEKTTSEFLDFIKAKINFSSLVVGYDFRLGKKREGGQDELTQWCLKNYVEFISVSKVEHDGLRVSSTAVREALHKNDFEGAKDLLGHPFFLEGRPVKDKGLGTKLGFPTINLKCPENLVLNNGVYTAMIQTDTRQYHSVINYGRRPTVEEPSAFKTLEAHILEDDFNGFEGSMRVFFKSFLRTEKKFESIQDLSLQIQKDIEASRNFFGLKAV